jgi:hypothetical protein
MNPLKCGEVTILGATVTNHNYIHKEIKSRLNSGKACCRSFRIPLSSRLLSKNFETKIYRIIMLPVVLYGYESCSLTLNEEHRFRVQVEVFWVVTPCRVVSEVHAASIFRTKMEAGPKRD